MSPRTEHEEEEEEEDQEKDESSGSEDDDALDEDMESLRRACMLTGRNPNDLNNPSTSAANGDYSAGAADADSDSDDDLELVRNIQNRFSISSTLCETLSLEPLSSLPPAASDEDDDFETLLAIQQRFSAHATGKPYTYMFVWAFCGAFRS